METIQNLYAVASSLTDDPELCRDLVGRLAHHLATVAASNPQSVTVTGDFVLRLQPQLSSRQQEVWFTLLGGYGVRETARQLGVSHPAIIKHRKRILRSAHAYLATPAPTTGKEAQPCSVAA